MTDKKPKANPDSKVESSNLLRQSNYRHRVMHMSDPETLEIVGWSVFRKLKGRGHQWSGITFNDVAIFKTESEARKRMEALA